jgi:HEPN domain-containing protein
LPEKKKKIQVDRARILAPDFHKRAEKKCQKAQKHLEQCDYLSATQAAQECCEYAMKAIYGFVGKQYTMTHQLIEEEYKEVLKAIGDKIPYFNYGRLFEIAQLWSWWKNTIIYGNEKLGVSASPVFGEKEAKLAVEHARECRQGSYSVRDVFA